ncbi:MAG: hypothetical protein ACOYKZ_07930, partial [Chlamydiia bacterium]
MLSRPTRAVGVFVNVMSFGAWFHRIGLDCRAPLKGLGIGVLLGFSSLQAAPTVSYSLSGGRLGDNLLAYARARWFSYRYQTAFHLQAMPHLEELPAYGMFPRLEDTQGQFVEVIRVEDGGSLAKAIRAVKEQRDCLIVITYQPEHLNEWAPGEPWWLHIDVDWEDQPYLELLRREFLPGGSEEAARSQAPSIMCHFRSLSGPDTFDASVYSFPLKHLRTSYFVKALTLCEAFLGRRLPVSVVTDDSNPQHVVKSLAQHLPRWRIAPYRPDLDARERHESAVVSDFQAMAMAPVLIATQSNLSYLAARMGYQELIVYPIHG